jgi:hypothetical protein
LAEAKKVFPLEQTGALFVPSSDRNDDCCLKIASETKKKKECAMNCRFREGFETGLKNIASSLSKKGGITDFGTG